MRLSLSPVLCSQTGEDFTKEDYITFRWEWNSQSHGSPSGWNLSSVTWRFRSRRAPVILQSSPFIRSPLPPHHELQPPAWLLVHKTLHQAVPIPLPCSPGQFLPLFLFLGSHSRLHFHPRAPLPPWMVYVPLGASITPVRSPITPLLARDELPD